MTDEEPTTAHGAALDLVSEQAEDEGLWFIAVSASEAYLQAALRRLHAAIESEYGCPRGDRVYQQQVVELEREVAALHYMLAHQYKDHCGMGPDICCPDLAAALAATDHKVGRGRRSVRDSLGPDA